MDRKCMICGGDAVVKIDIEAGDDILLCEQHFRKLHYQVCTGGWASVGFGV